MDPEGSAASRPDTGAATPPPGAAGIAAAGVPAGGLAGPDTGGAEVPGDADDTRRRHLAALARSPLVLGLTWALAVAALIAVGTQAGWAAGAGAAAAVLVLAAVVLWVLASRRAAEDFYAAYAAGRGLERGGRTNLPPVTALLARGDRRYAERTFSGTLPGGLAGSLAHYTYEEETSDSDGDRQTTYYHFTVVLAQLPETAPFIGELALQRRFGFRFLDSAEDVFRSRQRVELESELADRKFEVFIGKGDEMNRARQVFSPSFIVWLAEDAHEGIAFELAAGALVVNVKGHKRTAHELDGLCEAAATIARRLRSEAVE